MDDSIENVQESKEVTSSQFVDAVLRSQSFRIVVCGRAEVPRAWSGKRTFVRRGLFDSLIYGIASGQLMVHTPQEEVRLYPNSVAWFHGGLPARFIIPESVSSTTIYFCRFQLGDGVPLRLSQPCHIGHGLSEAIPLLADMFPGRVMEPDLVDLFRRVTIARLICLLLHTSIQRSRDPGNLSPRQQERCLAFIHGNIHRFFSLQEAASACGLNPVYFSGKFRRTFGQSFQHYVKQQRIMRAQTLLLETEMPIQEIAACLGYSDPYYFSRQFRQVTGMAPRQWRNR